MDLDACYRLARNVVIRPERFGGLIYRHDNRRLYFLYSHDLVDLLRALDGVRPLRHLLDDFIIRRALPDGARETFVRALGQLESLEVLEHHSRGAAATSQ